MGRWLNFWVRTGKFGTRRGFHFGDEAYFLSFCSYHTKISFGRKTEEWNFLGVDGAHEGDRMDISDPAVMENVNGIITDDNATAISPLQTDAAVDNGRPASSSAESFDGEKIDEDGRLSHRPTCLPATMLF